jgi:hypothetical protein
MDDQVNRFMAFLRFSLDDKRVLPVDFKQMDWKELFNFGDQQAINGVLYHGLTKLQSTDPRPDKYTIFEWYSCYEQIKEDNQRIYGEVASLTSQLFRDGYKGCVLKGQGNAMMYPDPYMRTSGDIDMWTLPTKRRLAEYGPIKNETLDIIRYVLLHDKQAQIEYHHIDYNLFNQTPVEIHYTPSFMGNLFYEYRMKRWFEKNKKEQFSKLYDVPGIEGGKLCFPTDKFNCIFQLSHIMHHFFFEGIGLRQVIDYYYLLKRGLNDDEKREIVHVIKWLNMSKFAQGLMWVLKEKLGLQSQFLYMEPNGKIGNLLFNEIVKSGNFGFWDERYDFSNLPLYRQYILEIYRNLHYAIYFPSETIWGRPLARWWHMIYKYWLTKKAWK